MPARVPTPAPGVPLVETPPRDTEPVIARGTRDLTPKEANERVALIAHDLKTPLSIISLEAQLLAERFPINEAVQRSLERISLNAAYIDRLVADLLDLASVDAGQLQLHRERMDLSRLLRETLERAVSTTERERVDLELRKAVHVNGDRSRIERVIANFVSNALKYSDAPIRIGLDLVGRRARVTVTDKGRGLTVDQVSMVFERYRRAGNTREGYGLGLYISRKIIQAHGGAIGVNSTPGLGSEFFFELDTI